MTVAAQLERIQFHVHDVGDVQIAHEQVVAHEIR